MEEAINWMPTAVSGGIGTAMLGALIYFIRKYIKSFETKHDELAISFKKFSDKFIETVEMFRETMNDFKLEVTTQHVTCNARYEVTKEKLGKFEEDIDNLYSKANELNTKVARLETKIK